MSSPAPRLRAPLLWFLVPFATGLVVAHRWPAPPGGLWPVAVLGGLATLVALWAAFAGRTRGWAAAFVVAALVGGYGLLHARFPHLHEWSRRPPREITLIVEIRQEFSAPPAARQRLGLATVTDDPANETALHHRRIAYSFIRRVSVATQPSGQYRVQGVLEPLPVEGRTGFEDYLANAGVRHRLVRARVLEEIRPPGAFARFCRFTHGRLRAILSAGLADQPAPLSLYLGMLLGEKAVLSPEQENAFMRSGTYHIFSISGLHVGIVAGALHILLTLFRLPRRVSMVAMIVVLWFYVQVTGGSSPALRAFLMIAFILALPAFRLPGNSLAALVASAVATLLWDPLQLFSTGFQMSYAVVAALILMGWPLGQRGLAHWRPFAFLPPQNWRWWHHATRKMGSILIVAVAGGWAAFLASTPAGIGYFGLLSPGSLLANLLVIPLSSLVIQAGFVSLVFGLVGLTVISVPLNLFAAGVVLAIDRLLQTGVGVPGMFFHAGFRAGWLAPAAMVLMTALMLACAAGGWSRRFGGFWPPFLTLLLLLAAGVKYGAAPVS